MAVILNNNTGLQILYHGHTREHTYFDKIFSRYGISMPSVKMRKIVQVGIGAVDYEVFYGLCFRCISGMRLRTASRQGERLQTPTWRRVTATALTGWTIMWTAQTLPALLVILYHCIFENRGQRFLLPQFTHSHC